jgi:uncharacterized membrane protein YidH (DUF202 family)
VRPDRLFDSRTPQERTSLAWERTAFAGMAVGLLMTRLAATIHPALAAIGIVQVALSAALLVWSGKHYEDLHGPLRAGESPTHPTAAKVVGIGATAATGVATLLALAAVLADRLP